MFADTYNLRTGTALILAIFVATQLLFVANVLLIPKPVEAGLIPGVPDLTIIIGNVYEVLRDIGKGILYGIAMRFIEKFIDKFVNKLVSKYKIRNYLYYDQVLTNYYLGNFIRDKVDDPKLREIYTIMESAYVTGAPTGYRGQPDPRSALIPRLKQKIYQYYVDSGGIPEGVVYNPPRNLPAEDYYLAAQYYWLRPPSFVEQNLQGQFGALQSASTTAAQLEIIVGNGLKAGRFVGGTCSRTQAPPEQPPAGAGYGPKSDLDLFATILNGLGLISMAHAEDPPPLQPTPLPGAGTPVTLPPVPAGLDPGASPQQCQQVGGTWQPSALDQARSFINNPTAFLQSNLQEFIGAKLKGKFDPAKFTVVVGTLIGQLLFDQFALNKKGGTLNEDPRGYDPEESPTSSSREIDIDDDGIGDGFDLNGDNVPDVCNFGGTDSGPGPPCKGSREAYNSPPPCQGTALQLPTKYESDVRAAVEKALDDNLELAEKTDKTMADGEVLVRAAVENLKNSGFRAGTAVNCNGVHHPEHALIAGKSGDQFGEYYRTWRELAEISDEDKPLTFREYYTRYFSYVEHANWERARE